jgi:DNA polymerase I-like protein with 3'-5' exonuclease and polymerase domains
LKAVEKDKDLFKKHRYMSKNKFVFPSFFGARPKSIARALGVDLRIAERLQAMFWDEFPDIKAWQDNLVKSYYKQGYVTGLSGFRRRAPVIHNELINSPIQSDESIIVCGAMIRVARLGLPCTMEIHDDLTFVMPNKKIDEYSELIIGEMLRITFDWINVPLEVERKIGQDWGQMKDAGKFESVGKNSWQELV